MTSETNVQLRDGSAVNVTREMVENAAHQLQAGDQTRVEVEVGGRRVEALGLLARAIGVPSDSLQSHIAYDALEKLDFHLEPTRRFRSPVSTRPPRPQYEDSVDLAETASVRKPVLTPDLALQLQRHRGEWVAIRDATLVASAATLRELQDLLADASATVVRVPLRPVADQEDFE